VKLVSEKSLESLNE